ncbi:MAG: hypothetical protein JO362_12855, partial [Streptomycetaceae bacterium]|nr:hypothetical protein [Streptomycetaceae bacterium]
MGFDGDPLPGDPRVLQGIIDDFTFLRDTAWSVSQGLDAFVASASEGFVGATADALREVVSGRLKTFVFNIARSFSLAGEAVAEYRLVLVAAQQVVRGAYEASGGVGAKDPGLGGLRRRVQDQLDAVGGAAGRMEAVLRDAAAMVSQPVKVPGLFERIWRGLKIALGITAMVLAILSMFVTGPLGLMAFAAGAAAFAMDVVDVARGRENWKSLLWAATNLLVPDVRGLIGLRDVGAGMRGLWEGA